MHLDNHLTWQPHLDFLLHKLGTACFVIRRLSHYYVLTLLCLHIMHTLLTNSIYYYFLWNSSNITKVFLLQKWMIIITIGVSLRSSCRGLLKKLHILSVPCAYVFSLIMFTVNNLDNYQTNSVVYGMHTSTKHQLHRPSKNGVFYSSIKIFNSLPPPSVFWNWNMRNPNFR